MARRYLGGSGERLTVWISIAASTVLIFYGYDQGVFGNVLVSDDFLRTMGYPSTADQGTMTSVYNLGCFAGALSTLYSGDKLGRPRTLMLGSSVIAVAAVIQAASYSAGQMYAGRVVAGLGTGMNTATAGVWQSETSKMRSRGKLIIIQMANCITGFAISNWLTLGFSFAPGSVSWRFPLAFQMCESAPAAVARAFQSCVDAEPPEQSSRRSYCSCAPSCPTRPACSSARVGTTRLWRCSPRSRATAPRLARSPSARNFLSSKMCWIENMLWSIPGCNLSPGAGHQAQCGE